MDDLSDLASKCSSRYQQMGCTRDGISDGLQRRFDLAGIGFGRLFGFR